MSKSLRASRVVIVGAGIAGYAAAAALAQTGFTNITILDSQEDPTAYEPNRAYSLVLDRKGQALLRMLTDFHTAFAEEAFCQRVRVVVDVHPDGRTQATSSEPVDGPLYWIMKFRLLRLFDLYIRERYPSIEIRHGVKLCNIEVANTPGVVSRPSTLQLRKDGKMSYMEFDMLLACDGSSSTVRQLMGALDKAGSVQSTNGMSLYSQVIPSSGIRTKGIVLAQRPVVSPKDAEKEYADTSTMYRFIGKREGRPGNSAFDLLLLPVAGGSHVRRRGTVAVTEGHSILAATSGEEMTALMRENFPQLDVESIFGVEETSVFAKTEASTFPRVERPKSLVGALPDGARVVFLGDSAHTLPLDTAQGSNSALQDVETMLQVLEGCDDNVTVGEALGKYEKKRDDDTWALVRLAPLASPYQYKQNKLRYARFVANRNLRSLLAKLLPGLCAPHLDTLMRQRIGYKEAKRRNTRTTITIWAIMAALVGVPLAIACRKTNEDQLD